MKKFTIRATPETALRFLGKIYEQKGVRKEDIWDEMSNVIDIVFSPVWLITNITDSLHYEGIADIEVKIKGL